MEKLFAAVRDQHPGFEVLDVKLLANQHEVDGQAADQLDDMFAHAIRNADGPLDVSAVA